MNKKGEMTITKLVGIILAIVILTLSIYAIVKQKSTLSNKIDNSVSDSTLDDLVLICNNHADMNQQNTFCCDTKTLKTEQENKQITCSELSQDPISDRRIQSMDCSKITCN
jgi:hypothetical protein